MIHGRALGEVFRFVVTGVASVALNVLIVTVLTEFVGLHYFTSIAVCFVTVTLFGFAMNRWWTFRRQGGRPAQELARYGVTTVLNLVVCLTLFRLMVERLHVHYALAMVLVSGAFGPVTYLLHRNWSFRLPGFSRRT